MIRFPIKWVAERDNIFQRNDLMLSFLIGVFVSQLTVMLLRKLEGTGNDLGFFYFFYNYFMACLVGFGLIKLCKYICKKKGW